MEVAVATVLLMVKSTITPEEDEAFGEWYDNEHIPQVLGFPGVISARRYKTIDGDDMFQYMALYEIANEESFAAFMKSDHLTAMSAEYTALFPNAARKASSYVQIWP
jgi:antibiotic biosynthesis monooxygenase (ABM) superfamily enzyme